MNFKLGISRHYLWVLLIFQRFEHKNKQFSLEKLARVNFKVGIQYVGAKYATCAGAATTRARTQCAVEYCCLSVYEV